MAVTKPAFVKHKIIMLSANCEESMAGAKRVVAKLGFEGQGRRGVRWRNFEKS